MHGLGRLDSKVYRTEAILCGYGPLADFETTDAYEDIYGALEPNKRHTVASARGLLVKRGKVRDTGRTKPHRLSGLPCVVWEWVG